MPDTTRDSDKVPMAVDASNSEGQKSGARAGSRRAKADERKDRLAQALRENLLRRKQQARARKQASDVPDANDLADPLYNAAHTDT